MTERKEIEALLSTIVNEDSLIHVILSAPFDSKESLKISIRPIVVKGRPVFQMTENRGQKALHRNLAKEECLLWLKDSLGAFKQTFFYTATADYQLLSGKKGALTLLKKPPSKSVLASTQSHNRQKDYLLQEGEVIPFLVSLGVMNREGKVHAAKRDKFRQINRFLEMIDDVLADLDCTKVLRIIDFGCGKAYLTFALYHYLRWTKGLRVHMTGLDLKSDVIRLCQDLALSLGYQDDLSFVQGDINSFETEEGVDMMVSLHACDTATDAALEKAVRWNSKVILCVPCCQHELFSQVRNEDLRPLLKHGILKERFAALATDAARAQLLEVVGYHTQILEFIDMEHTPKNLLIRAVKRGVKGDPKQAWEAYVRLKLSLGIDPSFERRLLEAHYL